MSAAPQTTSAAHTGSALRLAVPLLAGLLFGIGLIVSGMTDPQRILGFLDFAGPHWNPALALVMIGGLLVTLPAFAYARRTGKTLGGAAIALPDRRTITPRLVGGAALFGLGWGLSGVCPGPAILLAAGGTQPALLFFASLLAGSTLYALWERRAVASQAPSNL